jgi:hypothetical protein
MNERTGTAAPGLRWGWVAIVAAGALAAMEAQRLMALVQFERTLPFARDLLPGAIATAAMTLAAYLLIIGLSFVRQARKWALALGIGWGAIIFGSSLWVVVGPHVKNVWQELLLRLHLTNALIRYEAFGTARLRMAGLVAGLGAILAAGCAKGFAECPRDRLDRGIIMASIFYAAFYDLAVAIVARLVTPH